MSMKLGNTSVSSLLSSAKSAYSAQQSYNDQLAAYDYELSAKTPDDYQKYANYLEGRVKTLGSTDPAKALTLTRTQTSANRTFNSAEISRASLAVKYGDLSNTDKYNKMVGLLQNAINNGDDSLAQSLESQLGSLSVTIQNEQDSAARAASGAASAANTALRQAYLKDQDGARDAQGNVKNIQGLGLTGVKQVSNILDTKFQDGQLSLEQYQAVKAALLAQQVGLQDAAANDTRLSADDRDKYQSDLASTMQSSDFKKFAQPGVATAIQNGEQPFALEVDAFGNKSLQKREIISSRQAVGQDGKPLFDQHGNPVDQHTYQQDYVTGGKFNSFYRKDQNGNLQPYTVGTHDVVPGVKGLDQGQAYYTDPVSGKQVYLSRDKKTGLVQRGVETGDPGNPNPFAQPKIKAQETNPFSISDDIQNLKDLPGEAYRGLGKPIASATGFIASHIPGQPVLNFAGGLISGLVGRNSNAIAQRKAQEAQAYAIAQAAAQQRSSASAMAAIRANTPPPLRIAPAPKAPANVMRLPSPAVPMSPSQIFGQVAGKNPSNANISRGIAAAVGLNPDFKL